MRHTTPHEPGEADLGQGHAAETRTPGRTQGGMAQRPAGPPQQGPPWHRDLPPQGKGPSGLPLPIHPVRIYPPLPFVLIMPRSSRAPTTS